MSLFRVILVRMRENSDKNNSKYGHFLRSENVVNTFKKQCIFLVIKFLLLACIFHIILLSKQFFCKNNFGFGFLKSLRRTYVPSDLHHIGHLDRRVKMFILRPDCVHLTPRQSIQVCTRVQMDLPKHPFISIL